MYEKLRVIFTIPELRNKIFLTLAMLAAYRIGWQIPLPVMDQKILSQILSQSGGLGDMLKNVAVFSASNLQNFTIFGLRIMPTFRLRLSCSCSVHSGDRSNRSKKKDKQVETKSINTLVISRLYCASFKVGSS